MPYLGLAGDHVRSHAHKGYGEFCKVKGIAIANCPGSEYLIDVLAVDKTGGKAAEEVILDLIRGSAYVEFTGKTVAQGGISLYEAAVVVGLIIERYGKQVFLLIAQP